MGDQFGPPPGDPMGSVPPPAPPTPDYMPPGGVGYQPGYQAPVGPPPSGGGGKKTLLIVVIVVLLLCCCSTVGVGYWMFNSGTWDEIFEKGTGNGSSTVIEPVLPDTAVEPVEPDNGTDATTGAGVISATLSWDGPIDMDLELWDSAGSEFMGRADTWIGSDITDGSSGDEYFEFKQYSTDDFSTGEYILSVYYFGGEGDTPDTTAVLTVTLADGTTQTFSKMISYDADFDQWHVVRVNVDTGQLTEVNTVD